MMDDYFKVEFHDQIIVPTLDQIGKNSLSASFLLIGTALVETNLERVRQEGGGPGLGFYQMEPATHDSLWKHQLRQKWRYRQLASDIQRIVGAWPPGAMAMVGNAWYATAMARVKYLPKPQLIPAANDLPGLALYWKTHYNTFQAEQSHAYVTKQLERFIRRFPKGLLERA